MKVRILKEARVYLRRSTSAQESSLETQLQWAIDQARRLGIPLRASLDDLIRAYGTAVGVPALTR